MGLDFLRRTAKSSTKAWNRGREDLSEPTLFTQQPDCYVRTVLADDDGCGKPLRGETVTLHMQGGDILVVRENMRIGKVGSPSPEISQRIRNSGGCALGRVSDVHSLSGTFDVEVP